MKWVFNDGGRAEAGFKGLTRDCVCRSIAIATGIPYKTVYEEIAQLGKAEHVTGLHSHPRTGVYKWTQRAYLDRLGWVWIPTMRIGQGCKLHLAEGEMPKTGTYIMQVSHHLTVVKDGVIHDTGDPSRGGTRCVYGYYVKREHINDW